LAVNDFFIGQRTHISARYILKHEGLKEPQSSSGVIVSTGLGSTGWMKSIIAGASRISSSVIGHPYGAAQESERLMEADEAESVQDSITMPDYSMAAAAPVALAADFAAEEAAFKEPPASFARYVRKAVAPRKKSYGPSELSRVIGKWGSDELIFAVREPFPSKATGSNLVFGKITHDTPLRIESLMGENGVIFSDGMESDFLAFNSGTEAVITLSEKRGHIVV
ncbi:MAG: hypothetical protein LBJ59_02310, partial [Zoogloeaceae bacterium]|nr:hypothetical protein [Zoogloeaceae bacterium]